MPGDNWTAPTCEAVLTLDAALVPEFTSAVQEVIWQRLSMVLSRLERSDVQSLVIESGLPSLSRVAQDWRQVPAPAPTNHARRERRAGEGYPMEDDLVFGSQAELVAYQVLKELQRERPVQ